MNIVGIKPELNIFIGIDILSVEKTVDFDRNGYPFETNTVVYNNFGQRVKMIVNEKQYIQADKEFRRQLDDE